MEIEEIFIHNHYNDDNVEFDIALLKLAEPLDLSTFIPICLPKRDSTFVGSTAWVYGWGLKGNEDFDNHTAVTLQETAVQVISKRACKEHWKHSNSRILPSQLCAKKRGQDICRGDSGGPLSVEGRDGRHVLIGVSSYGAENCGGVTIVSSNIIDL